jgi:hypothetical protein
MAGLLLSDEMEESDHGVLELCSRNLTLGTEENHEGISQNSRCPSRNSKQTPKNKCRWYRYNNLLGNDISDIGPGVLSCVMFISFKAHIA